MTLLRTKTPVIYTETYSLLGGYTEDMNLSPIQGELRPRIETTRYLERCQLIWYNGQVLEMGDRYR